jgi:hypothetical protein
MNFFIYEKNFNFFFISAAFAGFAAVAVFFYEVLKISLDLANVAKYVLDRLFIMIKTCKITLKQAKAFRAG